MGRHFLSETNAMCVLTDSVGRTRDPDVTKVANEHEMTSRKVIERPSANVS